MEYDTGIQVTDTVPEGFEKFELSNGKTYCGRANGCFFCSHLTDIFLDWNGPYALICDCKDDTSKGISGDCPFFKRRNEKMFENKLIEVPAIGGQVYATRIISSWVRKGGEIIDYHWGATPFYKWCLSLGINEDDIKHMMNIACNGKLELETLAKKFLNENKGETSE